MGMNLDAYLYIKLSVNTETYVSGKPVSNSYVSNFSISVGDKIAKVDGKTSDLLPGHIKEENIVQSDINVFIVFVNLVIAGLSIYSLYFIIFKTKASHSIRNDYKLELNRILKSCQDRIVMVSNKLELESGNIINVRDFGELIKLSEELFKPILYWNSDNSDEESWFCVLSNNVTYRFILKK